MRGGDGGTKQSGGQSDGGGEGEVCDGAMRQSGGQSDGEGHEDRGEGGGGGAEGGRRGVWERETLVVCSHTLYAIVYQFTHEPTRLCHSRCGQHLKFPGKGREY